MGIHQIDINCDIGESFGRYRLGDDERILELVSSANVACGFHAGDPSVMRATVRAARAHKVSVGAHPGYPDLAGFGRREMRVEPGELRDLLIYQIGALEALARSEGMRLQHVKAHGALYNMAAGDAALADAIAEATAACDPQLILFGMAGSQLESGAKRRGLRFAREGFADRTYQRDGTLTPRSKPAAFVHEPEAAAERAVRMVREGKVETVDGSTISVECETICLHGDNPRALDFLQCLRRRFEREGIGIAPVAEIRR